MAVMKHQFEGRAFLSGSSYGGRQASLLAASPTVLVEGLLLLSYPLHPPGKPAQLRTAHFSELQTPALFVSGTKDVFGTIAELKAAIDLVPARTELLEIEGASHGLSKPGSAESASNIVTQRFLDFFSR
jgi:predicted alpha/beta-hydrolase family hydrolase